MSIFNEYERKRLVPKAHMIHSVRKRNWPGGLAGPVSELVDNGLGHGAATEIDIIISNTEGIAVFDNGVGVADINALFRYGDAGAFDRLSEIGQHGVGAKNAAIYLGDVQTVLTAHNDVEHKYSVNWKRCEESGEWPWEYKGNGIPAEGEHWTQVIITKLAQLYKLETSQKLGIDLGTTFAPALRAGKKITIRHQLKTGASQVIEVAPFEPRDLTDVIAISGSVVDVDGHMMRWSGRAGLSASMTERHNCAHIEFGHRVIETTADPFRGESAPTLYAVVALDDRDRWKYSLSEHKDKVVRYRDELIASINAQIKGLIEKSKDQAITLALDCIKIPLEMELTKALRGAGVLHIDPEEDPTEGGWPDGEDPLNPGPKKKRLRTQQNDGEPAKPAKKPTGVRIDWRSKEFLAGKLWSYAVSDKQIALLLDKDQFSPTIKWPPRAQEMHVIQLVTAFLCHAVEMDYWNSRTDMIDAFTPKLRKQIEAWAADKHGIAPFLNRAILESLN